MKNKEIFTKPYMRMRYTIALVPILRNYFNLLNSTNQYDEILNVIDEFEPIMADFDAINHHTLHNKLFNTLHNIKDIVDDRLLCKKPLLNTCWKLNWWKDTDINIAYSQFEKCEEYGVIDNTNKVVVIEDLIAYVYAVRIYGSENVLLITFDKYLEQAIDLTPTKNKLKCIYIDNCPYDINAALELFDMKKIDFIIGNPPYSKHTITDENTKGKKVEIWNKLVKTCVNVLELDGYMSLIHPSGWRSGGGDGKKVWNVLTQNQMHYLEMHDVKDGKLTFNADTTYDWYIMEKTKYIKPTVVKDQDNNVKDIFLNMLDSLPSAKLDRISPLLAKEGKETVEILHSYSCYETRKSHISKTQDEKYKHPCFFNYTKKGLQLMYSSEKKEHFGIPKVIVHYGSGRNTFIDYNGEYGMTQYGVGIVDSVENLEKIESVINSEKFKPILDAIITSTYYDFGKDIFKNFRKDFWKDFI